MSRHDDEPRPDLWEGVQDAVGDCVGWTAAQHAEAAEAVLDQYVNAPFSEHPHGGPPKRHYVALDRDQGPGEQDYAPALAGITHALLAIAKGGVR